MDARGHATYFTYDPVNRQKETIDALGNKAYLEFDENGNTVAAVMVAPSRRR